MTATTPSDDLVKRLRIASHQTWGGYNSGLALTLCEAADALEQARAASQPAQEQPVIVHSPRFEPVPAQEPVHRVLIDKRCLERGCACAIEGDPETVTLYAAPPAVQAEPVAALARIRRVLKQHGLTEVGDAVVEADLLEAVSPPADDEAVRLLKWIRSNWVYDETAAANKIDDYLAKVKK